MLKKLGILALLGLAMFFMVLWYFRANGAGRLG